MPLSGPADGRFRRWPAPPIVGDEDEMAKVEIYTTQLCGYCYRAKKLLTERGIAFTEIDVGADPAKREEMVKRAGGRRTVPQIFIDGRHIGGCDDLYALDHKGGLMPLVAGAG
jgi:glutaredoxin 3